MDTLITTGRIHDKLVQTFGKENVFKDVDDIRIGQGFRGVLRQEASNCKVMLVIIGPNWLNA